MEWKTIAEDSAKKAKTQRRRQEIPSLSVMTQLDVDVLWFGVTRKSGNEQETLIQSSNIEHVPISRCPHHLILYRHRRTRLIYVRLPTQQSQSNMRSKGISKRKLRRELALSWISLRS